MTTPSRFILGMAAGAAIGTAAALLLTPKTGKETRQIVANRTGRFSRKAGHYWGSLRQKISQPEGNAAGQHFAERQLEAAD